MTLNVTMVTPNYVLQASDRKMTSIPAGAFENDEANKGVVLRTKDGMLAVTFTGVGTFVDRSGEKRIDLWLAERLAKEGGPELPTSQAVDLIEKESTRRFKTFGQSETTRHSFIVAGWLDESSGPEAHLWEVTNYADGNTRVALPRPRATFSTILNPIERGAVHIHAFGLLGSLTPSLQQWLAASTNWHMGVQDAERLLVAVMRAAAFNPEWSWGINGNILTIAIARTGETRARLHRHGDGTAGYAPVLLWHQDGWTIMTGDGELSAPEHYAANFGDVMLVTGSDVAPPEALPPGKAQVSFRLVPTPGKYNKPKSSKEDINLPLVGLQPISDGAKAAFEGRYAEETQS